MVMPRQQQQHRWMLSELFVMTAAAREPHCVSRCCVCKLWSACIHPFCSISLCDFWRCHDTSGGAGDTYYDCHDIACL